MLASVVYHSSIGCHRKHEVNQFLEVNLLPVVYILLSDLGLRRFFFSIYFQLDNYFSFDWFEAFEFDKQFIFQSQLVYDKVNWINKEITGVLYGFACDIVWQEQALAFE